MQGLLMFIFYYCFQLTSSLSRLHLIEIDSFAQFTVHYFCACLSILFQQIVSVYSAVCSFISRSTQTIFVAYSFFRISAYDTFILISIWHYVSLFICPSWNHAHIFFFNLQQWFCLLNYLWKFFFFFLFPIFFPRCVSSFLFRLNLEMLYTLSTIVVSYSNLWRLQGTQFLYQQLDSLSCLSLH